MQSDELLSHRGSARPFSFHGILLFLTNFAEEGTFPRLGCWREKRVWQTIIWGLIHLADGTSENPGIGILRTILTKPAFPINNCEVNKTDTSTSHNRTSCIMKKITLLKQNGGLREPDWLRLKDWHRILLNTSILNPLCRAWNRTFHQALQNPLQITPPQLQQRRV